MASRFQFAFTMQLSSRWSPRKVKYLPLVHAAHIAERRAKASGNKHCKWVSHVVRTTLLYDLSASRLLLSDLPLPSISLMMWQRARLIKLNYFCSHLRLTVIQLCQSCCRFRCVQASVLGCQTMVHDGIHQYPKGRPWKEKVCSTAKENWRDTDSLKSPIVRHCCEP